MNADLVRVCRGVHRPAHHVSDRLGRAAALLSACSDDAVLAGRTVAELRGYWLPDDTSGRLEVIVNSEKPMATRRSYHRRPEIRARRQQLRPDEIVIVDGIAMTSPAKTFVDLADRLAPADLIALGDLILRREATREDLELAVSRSRGHRGIVRARAVLPLLDGRSRSRPESHLRFAVVSEGLPVPQVNVAVFDAAGQWLCEPDLSYGDVRLAIEYNGADHADRTRMRKDITRTLDVEDRGGWRVVTFGPAEVFGRPDQVGRRVRRLRFERGGRP